MKKKFTTRGKKPVPRRPEPPPDYDPRTYGGAEGLIVSRGFLTHHEVSEAEALGHEPGDA